MVSLVAPSRLAVLAADPNPERLRLTINRGFVTLVEQLAIYPLGLALFADSYELDDDASAAVLESLVTRAEGSLVPIIVASEIGSECLLQRTT